MSRLRIVLAVTAAVLAAGVPQAQGAAGEQITRISLAGLLVNGTGHQARGRILIRTPAVAFRRTNRDASPSARFAVDVAAGCQAKVLVTKRALATHLDPDTQARNSTRGADAELAEGTRPGGVWRLAEFSRVDPTTYEKTDQKFLYGLAVIPLAARRWMHVRVFADFVGSCSQDDRRAGVVATALERLLHTARVQARIVG